jgi:type IX secretion system PorP/SprF family membrane protein
MKKNNLVITIAIVFCFSGLVKGQSDPSFRQNQFNAMILNPAHTGANERNQITVNTLKNWVGFQGAPKTITATGNFNLTDQMGIGFTALNDEIGPVRTNRMGISGAYHLKLNRKWILSLGLSGMSSTVSVNLPSLTTTVANDPHLQSFLNSGAQLRAGFGGLLYSKNLYFGIAQPLIGKVNFPNTITEQFVTSPSFLAYTGGIFNIKKDWEFRPNLLYRYVKSFPLELDATAIFTYDKRIDFGLTYQLNSSAGAILGINLNDLLYVGYAYTYPTTSMSKVTAQSNEIALRVSFGKSKKPFGFQNPRFFN